MKKIIFKQKKKAVFCVIIVLLIILLLLNIKIMIKKQKIGNNMSSQDIVDKVLNLNSYKAKVCVQVNSNKSQNKYILRQEYNQENGSIQEVIEPENITGIKITRKDNNLKLENSNLDLKTIYENYNGLENNSLDLINFISQYKEYEKSTYEESDAEIILKVKLNKKRRLFFV